MSNQHVVSTNLETAEENYVPNSELIYRDYDVVSIDTDGRVTDDDIFEVSGGYLGINGNLTGRRITLSTEPQYCEGGDWGIPDEIVEPITSLLGYQECDKFVSIDCVRVPLEPARKTHIEAVDQDGKVLFENLKNNRELSHVCINPNVYLVNYVQGVERLMGHYIDAIPVQDEVDRLLLVNLTGVPVSVHVRFDYDEEYCYDVNPSRNFSVPTLHCIDAGYVHGIEGLPPQQAGVVLMVSPLIAAIGHALGRYDLVAIYGL